MDDIDKRIRAMERAIREEPWRYAPDPRSQQQPVYLASNPNSSWHSHQITATPGYSSASTGHLTISPSNSSHNHTINTTATNVGSTFTYNYNNTGGNP